MSIPLPDDLNQQLNFERQLHAIINLIHTTKNIDEIMLDLSSDICRVFNADRLSIYVAGEDGASIVSKVKTGLNSFKDIRLPIDSNSIAGYVAKTKTALNIQDVYDESELKKLSPELHFQRDIDQKTGYRTKQQLVCPIVFGNQLIGVLQLINSLSDKTFSKLEEKGIQTIAETLAIAMRQRRNSVKLNSKYDSLIVDGLLTEQEYELAAQTARRKGTDIETVLSEEFHIKRAALGEALSKHFKVPYEAFRAQRIKPNQLLKNLKKEFHAEQAWLPIEESGTGLVVMSLDPERLQTTRVVQNIFPRYRTVELRVSTRADFIETLDDFFGEMSRAGLGGSIDDILTSLEPSDEADSSFDEGSEANDNEVVKFVNKIIVDAYNQGASDIHIEPYPGKNKTTVRFRRDGSLFPYIEVPAQYRSALVTRIKIMCDLDISEKRKPQDGKIAFSRFGPLAIELRVATIPSAGGLEDVVMRLLSAGEPLPLEKLDIQSDVKSQLLSIIHKPYGMFLVCGPTGSGKTTTLHSVLAQLNTTERKIWTAEDPVEITQRGLRQVQVNRKAGLTFATAMRAFLRADPDIIMLGEMRDQETAEIGIEASLTGHLVLSTLHTNSAPESIVRLLDMGMDPFNFADALLGILAQRLAKRLCSCKQTQIADDEMLGHLVQEYTQEYKHSGLYTEEQLQKMRADLVQHWKTRYGKNGQISVYKTKGCEKCAETGYKGRIGLHELLTVTETVKRKIQIHSPVSEIAALAMQEGMRTLKMDGIEKVLQGQTDIEQVRAVCIK